jgi:hypothetical protein
MSRLHLLGQRWWLYAGAWLLALSGLERVRSLVLSDGTDWLLTAVADPWDHVFVGSFATGRLLRVHVGDNNAHRFDIAKLALDETGVDSMVVLPQSQRLVVCVSDRFVAVSDDKPLSVSRLLLFDIPSFQLLSRQEVALPPFISAGVLPTIALMWTMPQFGSRFFAAVRDMDYGIPTMLLAIDASTLSVNSSLALRLADVSPLCVAPYVEGTKAVALFGMKGSPGFLRVDVTAGGLARRDNVSLPAAFNDVQAVAVSANALYAYAAVNTAPARVVVMTLSALAMTPVSSVSAAMNDDAGTSLFLQGSNVLLGSDFLPAVSSFPVNPSTGAVSQSGPRRLGFDPGLQPNVYAAARSPSDPRKAYYVHSTSYLNAGGMIAVDLITYQANWSAVLTPESFPTTGGFDPATKQGYFALGSLPSTVVQLDFTTPEPVRVRNLMLDGFTASIVMSAAFDFSAGYAVMGDSPLSFYPIVIRIHLPSLSIAGTLDLTNAGVGCVQDISIHAASHTVFVVTSAQNQPGFVLWGSVTAADFALSQVPLTIAFGGQSGGAVIVGELLFIIVFDTLEMAVYDPASEQTLSQSVLQPLGRPGYSETPRGGYASPVTPDRVFVRTEALTLLTLDIGNLSIIAVTRFANPCNETLASNGARTGGSDIDITTAAFTPICTVGLRPQYLYCGVASSRCPWLAKLYIAGPEPIVLGNVSFMSGGLVLVNIALQDATEKRALLALGSNPATFMTVDISSLPDFVPSPTPTASVSATVSTSASPTATPVSATASATPSASVTGSETPSQTCTTTSSPTRTPSPTATASLSASGSGTPARTPSPSATSTGPCDPELATRAVLSSSPPSSIVAPACAAALSLITSITLSPQALDAPALSQMSVAAAGCALRQVLQEELPAVIPASSVTVLGVGDDPASGSTASSYQPRAWRDACNATAALLPELGSGLASTPTFNAACNTSLAHATLLFANWTGNNGTASAGASAAAMRFILVTDLNASTASLPGCSFSRPDMTGRVLGAAEAAVPLSVLDRLRSFWGEVLAAPGSADRCNRSPANRKLCAVLAGSGAAVNASARRLAGTSQDRFALQAVQLSLAWMEPTLFADVLPVTGRPVEPDAAPTPPAGVSAALAVALALLAVALSVAGGVLAWYCGRVRRAARKMLRGHEMSLQRVLAAERVVAACEAMQASSPSKQGSEGGATPADGGAEGNAPHGVANGRAAGGLLTLLHMSLVTEPELIAASDALPASASSRAHSSGASEGRVQHAAVDKLAATVADGMKSAVLPPSLSAGIARLAELPGDDLAAAAERHAHLPSVLSQLDPAAFTAVVAAALQAAGAALAAEASARPGVSSTTARSPRLSQRPSVTPSKDATAATPLGSDADSVAECDVLQGEECWEAADGAVVETSHPPAGLAAKVTRGNLAAAQTGQVARTAAVGGGKKSTAVRQDATAGATVLHATAVTGVSRQSSGKLEALQAVVAKTVASLLADGSLAGTLEEATALLGAQLAADAVVAPAVSAAVHVTTASPFESPPSPAGAATVSADGDVAPTPIGRASAEPGTGPLGKAAAEGGTDPVLVHGSALQLWLLTRMVEAALQAAGQATADAVLGSLTEDDAETAALLGAVQQTVPQGVRHSAQTLGLVRGKMRSLWQQQAQVAAAAIARRALRRRLARVLFCCCPHRLAKPPPPSRKMPLVPLAAPSLAVTANPLRMAAAGGLKGGVATLQTGPRDLSHVIRAQLMQRATAAAAAKAVPPAGSRPPAAIGGLAGAKKASPPAAPASLRPAGTAPPVAPPRVTQLSEASVLDLSAARQRALEALRLKDGAGAAQGGSPTSAGPANRGLLSGGSHAPAEDEHASHAHRVVWSPLLVRGERGGKGAGGACAKAQPASRQHLTVAAAYRPVAAPREPPAASAPPATGPDGPHSAGDGTPRESDRGGPSVRAARMRLPGSVLSPAERPGDQPVARVLGQLGGLDLRRASTVQFQNPLSNIPRRSEDWNDDAEDDNDETWG